jgi:DNA-binding MarR family transcriptional regulator
VTLPIPSAAIAQHVIALGKTGAGKSSAMRVLVEHLLEQRVPTCIVDPKGDWYGIKSSADGKRPGYPVVIFGGEHGDVPINEHSGAAVAELVATGNRPALIDLGGWMPGERTRFFIAFASSFFRHTRGLRHLVIDEVHNFAPQGKVLDVDAGKMLHWSNRLASEGRGKGITLIAASQRPQKVHKDFLTSCETLIAMKVTHPLDRGAVKDWMDGCADPSRTREIVGALAGLKRGEAFVWSPEIEFGPQRVRFPMFTTFDSFKPQAAAVALKGWASVDLDDVKAKLATVVAEAAANDPKTLKARIRELEAAAKRAPAPADPADGAELRVLRRKVEDLERRCEYLRKYSNDLFAACAQSEAIAEELADKTRALRSIKYPRIPDAERAALAPRAPAAAPPARNGSAEQASEPVRFRTVGASAPLDRAELAAGERAVLLAIAQVGEADATQIAVIAGYKKSSRDTYLRRLRAAGYFEAGWPARVTPAGLAALGDFEPLPTGDALAEHWLRDLGDGGEAKILRVLLQRRATGITPGELGEQVEYQKTSRDTYLRRLSARKLVEKRGGRIFASELLFG